MTYRRFLRGTAVPNSYSKGACRELSLVGSATNVVRSAAATVTVSR